MYHHLKKLRSKCFIGVFKLIILAGCPLLIGGWSDFEPKRLFRDHQDQTSNSSGGMVTLFCKIRDLGYIYMPCRDVMKGDRLIKYWSRAMQRTQWPSRCPVPHAIDRVCSCAHKLLKLSLSYLVWSVIWVPAVALSGCACVQKTFVGKALGAGKLKGCKSCVVDVCLVNATGIIIVRKPVERNPWLAFLCTAMPVWNRGVSIQGDTGTSPACHSMEELFSFSVG